MPISFSCSHCQRKLRAPDKTGGKQVKCPSCQTVLRVPTAPAAPAEADVLSDRWHVKASDGQLYGPVATAELDGWVSEGRVNAECQVLQQGSDQWRALTELYPRICDKPPARPPALPAQKPPVIPSAPETQLACPHCQSPIANDGSMSGQVVACPSCDGQLQMPALPGQVAAAPAQNNVEQQLAAISDLDHQLRIKKHREAAEKEGGGLETALDVLSLFG